MPRKPHEEEQSKWAKFEAVVQFLILIFAIFAVGMSWYTANTANQIAQNSYRLLNFDPVVYPYSLVATLNDVNFPNSSPSLSLIYQRGSLNLSFVVLTPHAMILNFTDNRLPFNFTIGSPRGINDTSIPDPDKWNLTDVFFYPNGYLNGRATGNPQAFVQTGITQVNFTIPLAATFYPNPLWLTMNQGTGTELVLGKITIDLSVFDVQTEQYLPTKLFQTVLTGWIYIV